MAEQPQVAISRIYLKDLSFESPLSPTIFTEPFQPEVHIDISVRGRSLENSAHEVVLELTVTGKQSDKTLFIVEVEQAGLFILQGLTDTQLPQALNVFCPSILFPYARQAIDSAMNQGGLPSLLLSPVNFEAMFQQKQQAST